MEGRKIGGRKMGTMGDLGMPVRIGAEIRRMEQEEFATVAYEVMSHAFSIHKELGRFFREEIYQGLLASRLPHSQVEVPITVSHRTFEKTLFIDLLVDGGAPFELKTVRSLRGAHRAQLLNYLLLTELAHGKLVNFRPESVEHEFANTMLRHNDRVRFEVAADGWVELADSRQPLMPMVIDLLRDWGTCLSVPLYAQAITHFLGGRDYVVRPVEVFSENRQVGTQNVRLAAPGIAFKVTAFDPPTDAFENHARRFLKHARLQAIQWINISLDLVTFRTIRR